MAKRENGTGSFRSKKTANGISIEFRVWHDGIQKSFSGRTETECKKKYREWVKSQNNTEEISDNGDIILIDYINHWLRTFKFGKVKDSTYDRLEYTINTQIMGSKISLIQLNKLTDILLQEFINIKSEQYSRSMVKKIYEVLNASLTRAYNNGMINNNVMGNVQVPNEEYFISMNHPTKEIEIYTSDEIATLKRVVYEGYYTNSRRYRYAPMYVLIANTGMRLGECLALRWDHVDFINKRILVETTTSYVKNRNRFDTAHNKVTIISSTKNRSKRHIPLNKAAIKALTELKCRQNEMDIYTDYVVSNYYGGVMQSKSVQDIFTDICIENGITPKGIHALRHTFASSLIQNNVDISIVSKLLGHSTISITYNTYIHIIDEQKTNAIEAIDF